MGFVQVEVAIQESRKENAAFHLERASEAQRVEAAVLEGNAIAEGNATMLRKARAARRNSRRPCELTLDAARQACSSRSQHWSANTRVNRRPSIERSRR